MRLALAVAAMATAVLAAGLTYSGADVVDPPVPRGFPGVVPTFLIKARGAGGDGDGWSREHEELARARDRRWLARSAPLGDSAPAWARRMYRRSLLVLRALVDRHGGAVAGARAGWAYVWPRDAGAVALAFASAGYRGEARRIARFLLQLELGAAARFDLVGRPIKGRAAQGDADGWAVAAARAAGLLVVPPARSHPAPSDPSPDPAPFDPPRGPWRGYADYQEKDSGDYLGNAIASTALDGAESHPGGDTPAAAGKESESWIERAFGTPRGLERVAGDPDSGLDSAAAWAVRPLPQPALFPVVNRTLLRLVAERKSRFGLVPSESWSGGEDPWTAPTAWTAWALAALAQARRHGECGVCPATAREDRHAALSLMADLRRAATPLGLLPERVDARTGLPASTTPLAWSHAFAILTLGELWP